MIRFGRIARVALVSVTLCMTIGASGVVATMTWQVPGDANAAPEVAAATVAPVMSLTMTAAKAYIDSRSTRMMLQAAPARAGHPSLASSGTEARRGADMRSFAQFEGKCLRKISKRRNARLVRVPCSPLQNGPSQSTASLTNPNQIAR